MIQAKQSLDAVAPYAPGRPVSEITRRFGLSHVVKLASNENPLGASPLAKEAVRQCAESIFMYPDPTAYNLRTALAERFSLTPESFIFGTGSDGLIELVCKTFLAEGDEAIMPDPSFSLYELNVRAAGATPVKSPLDENLQYNPCDMLRLITPKTKVIFLCNPNNPTGGIFTQAQQSAFLQALPKHILVVLDEAYHEYACDLADYPDSLSELKTHDNVLILRTFSKIYALAGLRVGYGMAAPNVIGLMEKVRAPFNVSLPAQAAAIASLDDREFVSRSLAENRANKAYMEKALTNMGLSFVPSATNFIAVNVQKDAKTVYEALLARGYIVKGGHVLGMPGYLRVTIGTKEECEGFINALAAVLSHL